MVIGFGARHGELVRLAQRLEVTSTVRFMDYQPRERLSLSLATGDLHYVGLARGLSGFVVPSRLYGVLAAGRPVVVSADADSEIVSIVEEAGCGLVVAPGRPDLVAGAIRDVVEGRVSLDGMGERGRAWVEERPTARSRSTATGGSSLTSSRAARGRGRRRRRRAARRRTARARARGRAAHLGPAVGVAGEDLEALREGVRVAWPHEEPGLALVHDVRDAADLRRHHRPARGERLDDRHRRALARRREDDRVADRVPRRDVVLVAEEEARARETEVVRTLLEPLAVVAVAHEEEQRVDPALAQPGEHRQEVVRPLDGGHAAEPADDELRRRDAVPPPHLGRVAVEPHARLELDPEPDDRELLVRRDVECDELVAHLGAHRDQAVGGAREHRLDGAEHQRPERPEVPAQDVAVEGVDDDRAPRAGEERRGAADRPRLGRVGVDDVRTELADEVRELERGKRVSKGRELPREPGQGHDLDPGALGHERHRLLAAADVAGHEGRLVPTVGEAAGEVGDVERRPSDVQARDHAQHPDRPARGRSAHRGRD